MTKFGSSSFAVEAYLRAKSVWRGKYYSRKNLPKAETSGSVPFSSGRDPRLLGNLLNATAKTFGWDAELDRARLITEWVEFVGERIAPHTQILEIRDGSLRVQCDSTAWATELRRLASEILTRVIQEYPDANITQIKFLAPGAPTWRHGSRTVPGRGPRDTYG